MNTSPPVKLNLACSILLTAATLIAAQSPKQRTPDAATLRTGFTAAFGKDFDLVKDEMKTRSVERGGGTYWLAYVKPKRTGYFYLQYRYLESGPLESREHEIRFSWGVNTLLGLYVPKLVTPLEFAGREEVRGYRKGFDGREYVVRDLAWKRESRIVDAGSPVVTDIGKPPSVERSENPTPSQAAGSLREGSAREVVAYFATIAPLQKKPLFETSYKGRRVSWQGSVVKVTDDGGEYHVYVWDKGSTSERDSLISLSVPKNQQSLVERLREGDRVAFDGVIEDFDLSDTFRIKVGSLAVVPLEKSSPTPTRRASR